MTGKGVARFLWWLIFTVVFYIALFDIFHIQLMVVLWMLALSFVYEIGAAIIKEAK